MNYGEFIEQPFDKHFVLRTSLLENKIALPAPSQNIIQSTADDFLDLFENVLINDFRKSGLLIAQLEKPLSSDTFISLGNYLGTPISEIETDITLKPYIERGVILNLISEYSYTSDISRQPFATNFLTLHTECSRREVSQQPKYIIFMCCDPGDFSTSAQTILVPMIKVEQQLSETDKLILSKTTYRGNNWDPYFLRNVDSRGIFSFRDFHNQKLEWKYLEGGCNSNSVNKAILHLLEFMYDPNNAAGIRWKRGMIVIVDNTFFFHGKTAALDFITKTPRHLKRLRILNDK